jgi:hypothetical protein
MAFAGTLPAAPAGCRTGVGLCPLAPGLKTATLLPMGHTMDDLTTKRRSHELAAIATSTARLVDQIARGYRYAYVAVCPIVACVIDELGMSVTLVRGYFRDEPHSWLEADGFRIDTAREYLDGGPLVEPLHLASPYLADKRFPMDWGRAEAVAWFANVFEFPEISAQRSQWILNYLLRTFVSSQWPQGRSPLLVTASGSLPAVAAL